MEIPWKWLILYFGALLVGFCEGFPLNLEDSHTEHAQFLTGIAAILITVGSVVLAGCLCCQRRKGFEEFHNIPVVAVPTASNAEHGQINPIANGEFTIFTPLSPPHFNNNVFLANEQIIRRNSTDYVFGDIDVRPWFEGTQRDFPRIKLKYIKELGKGRFGKIVEGAAQDLVPGRTWTPVIVRILDAAANSRERILFLNDALFYLAPSHPNVLALKGQCLSAAPLILLQESCTGGDLKSRLKVDSEDNNILQWCCQLTSALRHIHENGYIHPDLASRNCLLTDSLILKLGDYNLSPSKYPEDYYKGGEPLIPVRWRAPESLDCTPTTIQPKRLTKEANVWSLGVVIWEICENGSQPYGSLDDDEVISRVFGPENLRLEGPSKPHLYSDYIFRLIKMCWNNAESRPKVAQIDMMLSDLLQVHRNTRDPLLNTVNDDFDKRWESFKPNTIVKSDNHTTTIDIEGELEQYNISKPMSPSLNNLHGSLDNLTCVSPSVSSRFYNTNNLAGPVETVEPDLNIKSNISFKLGPLNVSTRDVLIDSPSQNDSLTDSMIFKQGSSGSDTEEENWRRKVERGAYSEKVRLKSRSVADLMVLTHVDYSESESETPLPSIDYKPNRSFRKSNLESSSLNFSSEGNLLNIEDTFEKELKKLQVERRDSLLFVPDNKSQNNSNLSLLHELNSPTDIKPMNQIYNIFNMAIDNFGALRVSGSKLNEIINIGDETRIFSRQDSENKSDLGYATLHNSERNSDFGSVDGEHLLEDRNMIIKTEIEERLRNCELHTKNVTNGVLFFQAEEIRPQKNDIERYRVNYNEDDEDNFKTLKNDKDGESFRGIQSKNDKIITFQQTKQNLPDILASLDQEYGQVNVDLLESNHNNGSSSPEPASACYGEITTEQNALASRAIESIEPEIIPSNMDYNEKKLQSLESHKYVIDSNIETEVPKLSNLVLSNDKLMQFINNRFSNDVESVIHSKLVTNESQTVPDLCSDNILSSDSVNAFLDINQCADEGEPPERNKFDLISKTYYIEDKLNDSTSTNTEENNESLLPEIQHTFVKDLNILEAVNVADSSVIPEISTNSITLNSTKKQPEGVMQDTPMIINQGLPEGDLKLNLFVNTERNNALAGTFETSSQSNQSNSEKEHGSVSTYFLNAKYCTEVLDLVTKGNENDRTSEEGDSRDINTLSSDELENNVVFPQCSSGENYPSENNITNRIGSNNFQTSDTEKNIPRPKLAFDLTESQQETIPNSLTHTAVFTSTPFRKKHDRSLPTEKPYSSLNLFGAEKDGSECGPFSSNFILSEPSNLENEELNYSLETWDNFLGKSFDSNRESNENLFDSFTSEPKSMLFVEENCHNKSSIDENGDVVDRCRDEISVVEQYNDVTYNKDDRPAEEHSLLRNNTFIKDGTFVLEEKNDGTFVIEDKQDETFVKEKSHECTSEENLSGGYWEPGGGWFLHPQLSNLSGNIEPQPSTSKGSYIGFGVDDEIMTAIRNELLEKLPHAQGLSNDNVREDEEWNQTERNEVFLRYNVYNTPLSPIPEELSFQENDEELVVTGETTPKLNDTDSDWSDRCELDFQPALSSHTNDSPLRISNHGHTPSQSSCCSNDTLFNFDDFASTNDKENTIGIELKEAQDIILSDDVFQKNDSSIVNFVDGREDKAGINDDLSTSVEIYCSDNKEKLGSMGYDIECHSKRDCFNNIHMQMDLDNPITYTESCCTRQFSLDDFLINERKHSSSACLFSTKMVAPLPSPEDKPWKSLPASLLSYETVQKPTLTIENLDITNKTQTDASNECDMMREEDPVALVSNKGINDNASTPSSQTELPYPNVSNMDSPEKKINNISTDPQIYEHIPSYVMYNDQDKEVLNVLENSSSHSSDKENEPPVYENLDKQSNNDKILKAASYENSINTEADYVNIENIDETKNVLISHTESHSFIENIDENNSTVIDKHVNDDHDMFGVLTDIRFSGPTDSQLMSTSFSESNDLDEQDWDSGSDTRSSSSGEFIWKEGEHEESLKALRAAPHDVLDDIEPMEEIIEENSDSDVSTSTSDEEGENLEFVPSAWDKFATPTKSALRSPEKSLDGSESKKSKGVWFKKQKYHCVYEYPREPESPVLHSQDLWKPQRDYTAFSDWEFDAEIYLPPPTADSDINPSTFTFKAKTNNNRSSLYYLTSPNNIRGDGSSNSSNTDEEYLGSSSTQPLDMNAVLCSQFFPGASNWIENVTPDSGLDDFTPGSTTESIEFAENCRTFRQVLPLRKLASEVINKAKDKGSKDVLGGLRHTRNKLKLDLPPSPSAFTANKTFTVEPLQDPVIIREKPTFSTFGKSRFLVQHVDTPTDGNLEHNKNVCFDVLPYKPINIIPMSSTECHENNTTYEPLIKNFDELSVFNNKKDMFIKGEASLLDSADEDSGIESSTLERKVNSVACEENAWLK